MNIIIENSNGDLNREQFINALNNKDINLIQSLLDMNGTNQQIKNINITIILSQLIEKNDLDSFKIFYDKYPTIIRSFDILKQCIEKPDFITYLYDKQEVKEVFESHTKIETLLSIANREGLLTILKLSENNLKTLGQVLRAIFDTVIDNKESKFFSMEEDKIIVLHDIMTQWYKHIKMKTKKEILVRALDNHNIKIASHIMEQNWIPTILLYDIAYRGKEHSVGKTWNSSALKFFQDYHVSLLDKNYLLVTSTVMTEKCSTFFQEYIYHNFKDHIQEVIDVIKQKYPHYENTETSHIYKLLKGYETILLTIDLEKNLINNKNSAIKMKL